MLAGVIVFYEMELDLKVFIKVHDSFFYTKLKFLPCLFKELCSIFHIFKPKALANCSFFLKKVAESISKWRLF